MGNMPVQGFPKPKSEKAPAEGGCRGSYNLQRDIAAIASIYFSTLMWNQLIGLCAQEFVVECFFGLTSISLTTCCTFGTFLARSSASFFCFAVLTDPFSTSVP